MKSYMPTLTVIYYRDPNPPTNIARRVQYVDNIWRPAHTGENKCEKTAARAKSNSIAQWGPTPYRTPHWFTFQMRARVAKFYFPLLPAHSRANDPRRELSTRRKCWYSQVLGRPSIFRKSSGGRGRKERTPSTLPNPFSTDTHTHTHSLIKIATRGWEMAGARCWWRCLRSHPAQGRRKATPIKTVTRAALKYT